mmetsp:Transcript_17278/g.23876  ORF Transcript_17278/g.23876 Transcript_17278/m.23876 type:complete len:470 (+) Transcript_17278:154-1563(+)|eukprot:CAMPEP_0196571776 /NCGR_PEP_ID=MMETSP1081-20130531/1904_1 /TAXON_ID=36882 /ORGANISM="Pyramimonas amylifera, Strain CCMP720" /LENGTH=469 /DNA_ID=CAMNT_0041888839 /DNA_START=154 /DNA_END=1563 /DNA_ORIENTATION=-
MPSGQIHVTVMEAKGLHDSQSFGKQDPYCVVQIGQTHYRGATVSDGGVNPTFNQKYSFNLTDELELLVNVWNSNSITSDDQLGTVRIPLNVAYEKGSQDVNAQVTYPKSGKAKGSLHVILRFEALSGGAASRPLLAPPSPVLTAEQQEHQAKIRVAFAKYDQDGNGGIDKNGMHALMQDLGFFHGLEVEKQRQVCVAQFEAADTSKDGWIDFAEFSIMYNRLLDSLRQHPKAQAYVPAAAAFIPPPPQAAPPPQPIPMAPPVFHGQSGFPTGPPSMPPAYPSSYPAAAPPAMPPAYPAYPGAAAPAYPPQPGMHPPFSSLPPPAPGQPLPYAPGSPFNPSAPPPGYPQQPQPGYPPTPQGYPSAGYPAPPHHGYAPQAYTVPPSVGAVHYGAPPPQAYGNTYSQVPAYYGAPVAYGAGHKQGKHGKKDKKYKGKKWKGRKSKGRFGMGAMGMALGGGLIGGMLLDDIFD